MSSGEGSGAACFAPLGTFVTGTLLLFHWRCLLHLPASFRSLLLAITLVACTRDAPRPATALVDDFGDTIAVGTPAARIASLNPTTTEILYAIGAGPRVVGRTAYDFIPAEVVKVPNLGAGLGPNVEAILGTHPDLVLLYASEGN